MDRQHRRLVTRCEDLDERIAEMENRVERLRNTLCAISREANDIRVSGTCTHCKQCYMLVRSGQMYCPECNYRRTV